MTMISIIKILLVSYSIMGCETKNDKNTTLNISNQELPIDTIFKTNDTTFIKINISYLSNVDSLINNVYLLDSIGFRNKTKIQKVKTTYGIGVYTFYESKGISFAIFDFLPKYKNTVDYLKINSVYCNEKQKKYLEKIVKLFKYKFETNNVKYLIDSGEDFNLLELFITNSEISFKYTYPIDLDMTPIE